MHAFFLARPTPRIWLSVPMIILDAGGRFFSGGQPGDARRDRIGSSQYSTPVIEIKPPAGSTELDGPPLARGPERVARVDARCTQALKGLLTWIPVCTKPSTTRELAGIQAPLPTTMVFGSSI
jgi:hypothetical protein